MLKLLITKRKENNKPEGPTLEICIKGHETIGGVLKKYYRQYDVILFTNSDFKVPGERFKYIETHCREMIHLSVDDVDYPHKQHVMPTEEIVKQALDWSVGRNKLICCCHAGVSRSSAMAYLIGAREAGVESALRLLKPRRHWPNRLIVHLGSRILNKPEIWTDFVHWQLKETGLDPSRNGAWPIACLEPVE